MEDLVSKIKSIQNTQKTLGWGSAKNCEKEIVFTVGSKAYPGQTQYFVIDAENNVFMISNEHRKEIYRKCENEKEVVSCVIELLKNWFPPKGI